MSTAVSHVVTYARDELGLHRLQAGTLVHNEASQRVLLRNGFERIGMAAQYLRIAGEWQDHLLFQRILCLVTSSAAIAFSLWFSTDLGTRVSRVIAKA